MCTENFIPIDRLTETPNVTGSYGRPERSSVIHRRTALEAASLHNAKTLHRGSPQYAACRGPDMPQSADEELGCSQGPISFEGSRQIIAQRIPIRRGRLRGLTKEDAQSQPHSSIACLNGGCRLCSTRAIGKRSNASQQMATCSGRSFSIFVSISPTHVRLICPVRPRSLSEKYV